MAIVADMIEVNTFPSIGAIVGSVGSQDMLRSFNSQYGGGTMFGQAGNPESERYRAFMNLVYAPTLYTCDQIKRNGKQYSQPETCKYINTEDSLFSVPTCMQVPILTYEPIRTQLENGVIHGWGIDSELLPDEDVVGRLINNGRVIFNDDDAIWEPPTEYVWEFKTTDPRYTDDELEMLEVSREYVADMLRSEMLAGATRRDPTDWGNGKIGKIK